VQREANQSRVYREGTGALARDSRRLDFGQDRDPIAKLIDVHADHI
jgi:hypothetical protein